MNIYSIWTSIRTALWGYSVIILLIFILIEVIPHKPYPGNSDGLGVLVFAPILLYILNVVIDYKSYNWNWWKYVLGVYTLLITALVTLLSTTVYTTVNTSPHHGNPYGSALLLLPIFVFFIVIKRKPSKNNKNNPSF